MRNSQETFFGHARRRKQVPSLSGTRSEIDNRGGLTIAWKANPQNNRLVYSVARCSDEFNFKKKLGRNIAGGRLKAGKCGWMELNSLETMKPGEITKLLLTIAASK